MPLICVCVSNEAKMIRGDVRSIVLYGFPGDEKTDFERRESTKGRVAYVSGEGRGASKITHRN